MIDNLRRLHPRNGANRGVCVDAEGATLGPDCILVHRIETGYRELEREEAAAVQRVVLNDGLGQDWLFDQSRRIAQALSSGQIALAQIYGLYIPINGLDDQQLRRLAAVTFARVGFNPDEPRVPKGDPHGGEWTTGLDGSGGGAASPETPTLDTAATADAASDDSGGGDDTGNGGDKGGGAPDSGEDTGNPPSDFRMVSPDDPGEAPSAGAPETASAPAASGALQTNDTSSEAGSATEPGGTEAGSQGSAESNLLAVDDQPPIEWTIDPG